MRAISSVDFETLLKAAHIKPRLRQEIRFIPKAAEEWADLELAAISDRSNDKGVLLLELDDQLYITSYDINRKITDRATGRTKPIICDFCFTWQKGSNAGRIRFTRLSDLHAITLLCCADLACSSHARTKTAAALLSRAQLHEDLNNAQRVARLQKKLSNLVELLGLEFVTTPS